MTKNLDNLFKDKSLLTLALTHKSWVNEHSGKRGSNERLEFLGDAVLEFVVSKDLFLRFPEKEEGYLTALRANLVNTISLSEIAGRLSLGEVLYLSRGEEETGGRKNQSILANCVEAIIGALFIDQGLSAAESFINDVLLAQLKDILKRPLKDAKSLLQEYVQAQGLPAPRYRVAKESGPDHAKKFIIETVINEEVWSSGVGKNKSEAAQEAAREALLNASKKFSNKKL